jgi:TRAP-type C4-dicarboxylate transport system permease small subunit
MSDRLTAMLAHANERATLFLARISAAALAVIALTTFCDVIGRYFFHAPFSFTVELTEMGMAVLVYFGIGLVTHENGHISADFLVSRLPPKLGALLAVVTNLLALGFVGLTIWQLWLHAFYLLQKGDLTQNWRVPLWPVAFAAAFGSLFLLTGVLLQLIAAWTIIRGERPPASLPNPGQPSAPRFTE